jgi:hypothetical protein
MANFFLRSSRNPATNSSSVDGACLCSSAPARIEAVVHLAPAFLPPGNLLPSAFVRSTQRRLPSTIAATARDFPSGVLGPVERPPWKRQRVLPGTGQFRQ